MIKVTQRPIAEIVHNYQLEVHLVCDKKSVNQAASKAPVVPPKKQELPAGE